MSSSDFIGARLDKETMKMMQEAVKSGITSDQTIEEYRKGLKILNGK